MKTTEAIQHEKPLLHMLGVESWLRAHGKFVRPELTKQQKQELNECFDLIDADGSGAIDADELLTAFNVLGLHVKRSEIEKMLAEVDADGSGEVEYPEFVQIMTSKLETQSQEVDSEEKSKKQPLPFQLLAQAYRRKKLIDAVMSGDKATQQRLRTKAEAAEAERQAVLAAMDAEKQNPALRFDKKNMKTLSGNKYQRMQPSQREFETDHVVEDLDDDIKKIVLECLEEETIQSSQSESKRVQNNDPMLKQRSSLIEGRNQTNRLQITKSSSLDKNSVQGTFKQELADLGRQRSRVLHKPVLEHQLRHLRAIKSIQDYVKLKDIQNIKYLK